MTDLEYAQQVARELIPLPEMAGSEQLRRSITRAILRARADEAHMLGLQFGGWNTSMCFRRASDLRLICDGSASNPTAPTSTALPQSETAASLDSQKQEENL